MGPYQRTPKEVARAIGYAGLGVRSVGPVGYFLDILKVSFVSMSRARKKNQCLEDKGWGCRSNNIYNLYILDIRN